MLRTFLIVTCVAALSACGAMVPVVRIDDMSLEQRRAVNAVEILSHSQLANRQYSIVNIVEGISCKNKVWDHAATKSDAIFQVKHWAREAGADAISNVQCDSPRGTTVTYNCWESVTCTAEAIKFKR